MQDIGTGMGHTNAPPDFTIYTHGQITGEGGSLGGVSIGVLRSPAGGARVGTTSPTPVASWMNSPAHRDIILSAEVYYIGLGNTGIYTYASLSSDISDANRARLWSLEFYAE